MTSPTLHLEHPDLRVMVGWRTYRLGSPWRYRWLYGGKVRELYLPEGFVTDLASVPKILHWWIGPRDLRHASLPHDLIYQRAGWVGGEHFTIDGVPCDERWTRKQADELMARIMRDAGVEKAKRRAAYLAVRAFGWTVWRGHERARAKAAEALAA